MYASMPDSITSVMRSAQKGGSLTRKQKSFQGKISKIPPEVPTSGRGKTSESPPLWMMLKRD
ncbi:hypothetical protein E2C01_031866 [Portunus trituberculatus]|uniref:Uncharacterized protein n=1 Tax=Portunus trituberculatus TaxID=210409 RepID=A0A5B7ETY2_PORTR|nr:hypothetical protein [Portunus trituberculatus]